MLADDDEGKKNSEFRSLFSALKNDNGGILIAFPVFPERTMLVRPFVPSDLLAFNAVNLDYYTETVSAQ